MKVPFAGGSYRGVSPAANAQKCVNLYVENDLNELDEQGNPKKLLVGTPGLTLFKTMANLGAIRAMHVVGPTNQPVLYVISAGTVYKISSIGIVTSIGTITTTTNDIAVYMADNGINDGGQILITDGVNAYIINISTNTLTVVSDASLNASPSDILQFNSWFICKSSVNSEAFQLSKLGDGTTWTPLQQAEADAEYDGLIGIAKEGNKLLLLGSQTTEVWWNTGNADFPFQRMGDGVFYVGCVSGKTIARAGGKICWLGRDSNGICQVFAWNDGPTVISTPDIEYQLRTLTIDPTTGVMTAIAYGYHDRGHDFYVLTSTHDVGKTFVYDFTTQEWHQRSTGNSSGGPYNRHIGNCYAFFNGKHYIGDFNSTGKIYEMTSTAFDDAGTTIYRERVGVHFNQGNERINLRRAGLVFGGDAAQSGVGATATLQWSKDRGFNWSTARTPDKTENGLSYWEQLGLSRDWLFWLRCSSATEQCVITDAVLEPSEN